MLQKILVLIFVFFSVFTAHAKENINIFAYSRPAPESAIYDINGKQTFLKDFNGQFIIAVFWSKTCIPCIKEIHKIREFVEKTSNTGITLLMISPEKDWSFEGEHQAFINKYGGNGLNIFTDKGSTLANDFGIFTSPHAVLINADSMEIGRIRGFFDWDDEDSIEKIYEIKALH